jgi:hypothetical protein
MIDATRKKADLLNEKSERAGFETAGWLCSKMIVGVQEAIPGVFRPPFVAARQTRPLLFLPSLSPAAASANL